MVMCFMFTLWKSIKLYIYYVCTLLNVCYVSKSLANKNLVAVGLWLGGELRFLVVQARSDGGLD